MKHLKFVLFITLGILCLCFSYEKDHLTGKFLLTEEMKAQNPYQGGETLFFHKNNEDTIVVFAKDRVNKVHEVLEGINTKNYFLLEEENIFLDIDTILHDTSYFHLKMMPDRKGKTEFTIDFIQGTVGRGFYYNLPLSTAATPYIDSLFVMNRWVRDVFTQEHEILDSRAYKLYYSTEFGILKIDFSDGSYWELEKIEWAEEN